MSPLFELLERSTPRFSGKNLLVLGEILDEQLLKLAKGTNKAHFIVDNFITANSMAAMLGQTLDGNDCQTISLKHITVAFSPLEKALKDVKDIDLILVLLSKNKQATIKTLSLLNPLLKEHTTILLAGENSGGGKSAGSLLKPCGEVVKLDLARKCTLFGVQYRRPFPEFKPLPTIQISSCGTKFNIEQDPSVFAQGRLDEGTSMLLYALSELSPCENVLDLGCGCGIVGLFLRSLGFKQILSSDVSAQALYLAKKNAISNNLNDISYRCTDMLDNLGKFNLIAVNPPFHKGLLTTTTPTINMINKAPEHLSSGGVMYLVANAHLPYMESLKQAFNKVSVVKENTRYKVYRACN